MRACKQDFTVYNISKWREGDHLAFFKEQGFEQGTATVSQTQFLVRVVDLNPGPLECKSAPEAIWPRRYFSE